MASGEGAPPAYAPAPVIRDAAGLGLRGSVLRFDPPRPADLAFVSSARHPRRRAAAHRRVIATADTLRLLGLEPGADQALPAPLGRPFELGRLTLDLLHAGHVAGAAQLRAVDADGSEVCYAGGWRGSPSVTFPAGEIVPCDVLVLDARRARPGLRFPPRVEAADQVVERVRAALRAGRTPVLLADPLGAAPELSARLAREGLSLRAHLRVREVLQTLGVGDPGRPRARALDAVPRHDDVVLLPDRPPPPALLDRLGPHRVIRAAWDAGRAGTQDGASGVCWSDHGDYRELSAYAEASGARHVLAFGAAAPDLVEGLRRRGLDARALDHRAQLPLL